MVADDDGWARGRQVVVRVLDGEGGAGAVEHDVFEGARDEPLCVSAVPDEAEEEGDEDAVAGAGDERDVGDQEAGEEAGGLDAEGEHVEDEGECEVAGCKGLGVVEEGGHVGRTATGRSRGIIVCGIYAGRDPLEEGRGRT